MAFDSCLRYFGRPAELPSPPTSLIDAQRVVMRDRWPEGKTPRFAEPEYAEALARIFQPGGSEFLVKLRHYCTHRSMFPRSANDHKLGTRWPAVQSNALTL